MIAPPRRAIRLRPHRNHFVPVIKAAAQGRHCRIGRAHEDQTHRTLEKQKVKMDKRELAETLFDID